MIVLARNKKWSDLTGRQEAPIVLRGIVLLALLAAAQANVYRRPAEEINGGKLPWSTAAPVNCMGIGPIVYFVFGRK